MKLISLSVRDFAVPVPRVGSIDAYSGFGRSLSEGQEIHARVQKKRLEADDSYQAEVFISHTFERAGYEFQISGRMDGVFEGKPPKIEEIKTSLNIRELAQRLKDQPYSHPYSLQLLTYGYLYWRTHDVLPELSFHLVSSRNSDQDDLKRVLDLSTYEEWLDQRLEELVSEARRVEKRIQQRKKLAEKFEFPFQDPRPGQKDLIETLEQNMLLKKRMMIQAPTGLGKTVGVLYPTLKEALSRGQSVIYVTPKNTQHAVVEDAVKRFKDTGTSVKSLTLTAKSKICFKNEPICNPHYCEYARDHYAKVDSNSVLDILRRKRKLRFELFRELGEEFEVCPFELQFAMIADSEVVICDYNYVFAGRSSLAALSQDLFSESSRPNLVVDEAHNLPARSLDYYSPALSSTVLEKMKEEAQSLPSRYKPDFLSLIEGCLESIRSCQGHQTEKSFKIKLNVEDFYENDHRLRSFLSRYLETERELKPRDVVLRLCFYWSEFVSTLEYVTQPERTEFFTTFHAHPSGGVIKITCCDASEMLKGVYSEYEQVVFFSATLKPADYYLELSGLSEQNVGFFEFQTPFKRENRKLMIIPQISTKYTDRERNYPKIIEVIQRVIQLKRGNYFAFFPSFEFMNRVHAEFRAPEGYTVLKQEREMKSSRIEEFLNHLKERSHPTVIFAVQGGVFSEGVDYPGEMVIGAFIIGPPLPTFDLEREEMRKYYDQIEKPGFDYVYTYPAMAKAIQAAGRVIRSETDRGVIVLMDRRFMQMSYTQSMPQDWFLDTPQELVSGQILKDVEEFWNPT